MGKFLLELAIFAGILCQISVLTGYTGKASEMPAAALSFATSQAKSSYNGGTYTMDPNKVTPYKIGNSVLEEMATAEAKRIIQSGDYESFSARLEENAPALKAMGLPH